MEKMETTEERQKIERGNVDQKDSGYKALAELTDYAGGVFGPDLRGNNN